MGFHEEQFPTDISYGSRGGPGHNTAIIELPSGAEERVGRWGSARRRYDASYGVKNASQLGSVLRFVLARQGALYGFRYRDFSDYASTADGRTTSTDGVADVSHQNQSIATGDGTTTQFQLTKTYTSGPNSIVRRITKPVASTVVIAFSTTQQTTGWTVDDTTGIVTFTTAPTAGTLIRAGFEFDVPVRFEKSIDELFEVSLDNFDQGSVPSIGIVELVDEEAQTDLFFYGGAKRFGVVSADVSITANTGRVVVGEPGTAGLKVILPDAKNYAAGGPWWLIVNEGTQAWSVRNSADTQIVSVPSGGGSAEIWLSIDSGGNKVWWAK